MHVFDYWYNALLILVEHFDWHKLSLWEKTMKFYKKGQMQFDHQKIRKKKMEGLWNSNDDKVDEIQTFDSNYLLFIIVWFLLDKRQKDCEVPRLSRDCDFTARRESDS